MLPASPSTLSDLPVETVSEIFSWIHPLESVKLRRLSRSFNACLLDPQYILLNLRRCKSVSFKRIGYKREAPDVELFLFLEGSPHQAAYVTLCEKQLNQIWLSLPFRSCLPAQIGRLTRLIKLNVFKGLRGKIPREIGHLVNLTVLNLQNNALNGSIPIDIMKLIHLEYLNLSCNQLSGKIPVELAHTLSKLTSLYLHKNRLTGPLPSTLGNLLLLKELQLNDNLLTGRIPPFLGMLSQLEYLHLNNNLLTGPVPEEIGSLDQLKMLHLLGNSLFGPLPAAVVELVKQNVCDFAIETWPAAFSEQDTCSRNTLRPT
ncbi:hypothetical protein BDR26DRAFT_877910 [Obelidium mucronatum]|nr:hypothetical protein BDR26DRAFT_877910 [Obelidium mucronatum]